MSNTTHSPWSLLQGLRTCFGATLLASREVDGEVTIEIEPAQIVPVCTVLRNDNQFGFEQLIDLCGVDYLEYGQGTWQGPRYAVVYHLLSMQNNMRLRVRTFLAGDLPMLDSVIPVWAVANWYERETFDLYGILFLGHPDLRRLLTDYGFIGHPFRKDFPLIGNVEMRYDPDKKRVAYEPVTIEDRTLVPRIIRHDSRYEAPTRATPGARGHG